MLTLSKLIDENKCYEIIRQLRWPDGVSCVECGSSSVTKRGKHETHPARQRYVCSDCARHFDDLTNSIFAGRHQPLQTWIACLYLMGLNLSNQQISQELSLHKDDVHQMTSELRQAIADKRPEVQLSGTVEFDEVYVTAGHKGQPEQVKKKGRQGRRRKLKGVRGRGTLEKEKPPIFGMIQRGGEVVIQMLANVQQKTIQPIIQATVSAGTLIYTDEYDIYAPMALT
ncbi:MAG: IS1595 family transposase [Phormidesmis sp.]